MRKDVVVIKESCINFKKLITEYGKEGEIPENIIKKAVQGDSPVHCCPGDCFCPGDSRR